MFTPLEITRTKKNHKENKFLTGFKDKRVTIMGLGLLGGGVRVAKFFCKQGAKVLVTDLKTREQLKESIEKLKPFTFRGRKMKGKCLPVEYILGRHRAKDFLNTDLIIKNPAVPSDSPYLKIARKHKIPIKTDISIFFDLCKAPIIGVTGTKGKSTVATLIYLFLKKKYHKTILAGNIGVSPLEALLKISKKTRVVLELSSFELEGLKKSPELAVITNIYPDHLNRYKNLGEYIEAKKNIFLEQRKKDVLILNYDNLNTRKLSSVSPSQVYFYSQKFSSKKDKRIVSFIKGGQVFFNKEPICKIEEIKIEGEHNISNALAGLLVAKILQVSSKEIKRVLRRFEGVSCRQEFIKEIKGVKYFNDTTATTPESTIVAIRTFRQRFPNSKIVLIAGGQDKNLNYKSLAKEIQRSITYVVLLPGTASDKIKKELKSQRVKISPVSSMERAVRKTAGIAAKGDIVLLSPGAASFNLFKNEFDRGEQFNKAVRGNSPG